MKTSYLLSLLFLFSSQTITNKSTFNDGGLEGILLLYSGKYTEETSYKIYNLDKTLFAEIKSINGNEPSCPILKGKILAYYDDYYIFHFSAKYVKSNNTYEIKIGNSIKEIIKDESMVFLTWQEYVLKFYCKSSKENPVRLLPEISSKEIKVDYENTSFRCIGIKGDWVKVECNQECDGCPTAKKISGWIRWRIHGKVILNQILVC